MSNIESASSVAQELEGFLSSSVAEIAGVEASAVGPSTPLSGSDSPLSSRDLVELLLVMEDHALARYGVRFDWSNRAVLPDGRRVFATVGSLAEHIARLANGAKGD